MPVRPTVPIALEQLVGTYAVCRLAPDAPIPNWADAGGFVSITRTDDELSVACRQEVVPEGVVCERGWRCLRVAGRLDFALVGVLHALLAPLAEANVSVFVVSTFDTDYLFVKEDALPDAAAALRRAAVSVQLQSPD